MATSTDDYELLVMAEALGDNVTVDCKATDGYYDVTLSSGHEVRALSWYHLDGFTEDGPDLSYPD